MSTTHPDPLAPTSRPRRHIALRVGLVALLIATAFHISVESSSRPPSAILEGALVRGAERLLDLQLADGLWPSGVAGAGNVSSSGRSGRALLRAWRITRDSRHLAAARRAADAIIPRLLDGEERAASPGNMMFLAELSAITGDPHPRNIAHQAWARRLTLPARADGALAAKILVERGNPTAWLDGSWRNYLLSRASDEVELARVLGEKAWADAYAVEAAESWAPKRDYEFWASATSGMVLALAGGASKEAQRLLDVELSMLRHDELAPGLPWSDSPYDSYVYASETAAVLRGLIASGDNDARRAAVEAGLLVSQRQAAHGGWGEVFSLFDQIAETGSSDAPAAELAADETPELDALLVLALAELLEASAGPKANA